MYREEQAAEFELLRTPEPADRRAVIPTTRRSGPASVRTNWPFACRWRCPKSSASTAKRRRLTQAYTDSIRTRRATFGQQMLTARRLVERGVRFVQVYHGSNGGAGTWDAHSGLKASHDQALQAGRSADRRAADGPQAARPARRDDRRLGHRVRPHAGVAERRTAATITRYGFSVWMAGGGIKGGVVHGATDELGFHAVENRHYVTDIHATVLHQLGLAFRAPGSPRPQTAQEGSRRSDPRDHRVSGEQGVRSKE